MSNATVEAGLPYTWIVVVAGIVSFVDAFAIGANDVANSFATSVASKSLTLRQAVGIACFTEFFGALLLGSGVAETIRKGIIDTSQFKEQPYLLMLAMMCANIGSSVWVMAATFMGMPVSTTHSVVGAIMGTGIAAFGAGTVKWGWDGFAKIVASWFISPVLAGVLGAILFLIIKYGVMLTKQPYKRAQIAVPIYYFLSFLIITFFIFFKGSPRIKALKLSLGAVVGISVGTGVVAGIVGYFLVHKLVVPHITKTPELNAKFGTVEGFDGAATDPERADAESTPPPSATSSVHGGSTHIAGPTVAEEEVKETMFTHGINADVVTAKTEEIQHIHDSGDHYDGQAERVFTSLQVLTAAFASFSHGANDLANALAPFAAVVYIYENGEIGEKKQAVPFWQIAYCAIGLDMGLFFFGYKIMSAIGSELTLHSPCRGFCMELSAMLTVLIASKAGIPVSTTHCITGATTGVAMCNKNVSSSFNYKKFAIIFFGWLLTVPMAGLIAGLFFAMMAYSPVAYAPPGFYTAETCPVPAPANFTG
jgi:sodium-dependent phosphate transporter